MVRQDGGKGYIPAMSYLTLEVEIDHGRVVPKEPDKLPEKGTGLLTILPSAPPREPRKLSQLEAFHALQKHLNLDEAKAQAWMDLVREARR